MEQEKTNPRGYYVTKENFFVHASVVILAVAAAARLLGTMNLWSDPFLLSTQIALPVFCALLFLVFLLAFGRIALWTTILPVLGGAAFFILSASGDGFGLQMIACIVMAFLAAFVYTATLAGMIRTKWLNVIAFALILAYQIVFLAVPLFGDSDQPISFADGTTLISSICLVLGVLLACLAFRRKKIVSENVELPKIKAPKVIAPAALEKQANGQTKEAQGEEKTGFSETAVSAEDSGLPCDTAGSAADEITEAQ